MTLVSSGNLVSLYQPNDGDRSAFGFLISERLASSDTVKLPIVDPRHRDNKSESFEQIAIRSTEALHDKGQALSLDDPCLQQKDRPESCKELRTLIFGSGYSNDDRFDTFAGKRDGVDIHAAIAVCPKTSPNHFLHFIVDILLGAFVFSRAFNIFWKNYFETLTGKRKAQYENITTHGKSTFFERITWWYLVNPSMAYIWLVAMMGFALFIILSITFVSIALPLGPCLIISSSGMVVGMLIEAGLVQGVEVSSHEIKFLQNSLNRHESVPVSKFNIRRTFDLHDIIRLASLIALLALALLNIFHLPPFAEP